MKTQMRFQKILMLVSLIITAITFVFGLFFLTGGLGYAGNYITVNGVDLIGAQEFVDTITKGYVKTFINLAIVFIVLAAVLYITSCNKRRNYYITNYIAIGLFVAFALAMVIYIFIMVGVAKDLYVNSIDWERVALQVADHPEWPMSKTENYQFIVGYLVAVIILIDAVLLVLSTVWKVLLMKGEKALLAKSAKTEVGEAEEVA